MGTLVINVTLASPAPANCHKVSDNDTIASHRCGTPPSVGRIFADFFSGLFMVRGEHLSGLPCPLS